MTCGICQSECVPLDVESFLFPATSYAPEFHEYENRICTGCGVVSMHPAPDEERLAEFYNTTYRRGGDAIEVGGRLLDTPVDFTVGGKSLARVKTFHDVISANASRVPELVPSAEDTVIDYGAYQGMFLYGVSQLWGCRCIAYDYSESGIDFARRAFGFTESRVAKDINSDVFAESVKFVTMIHALEHMRDPVRFLTHVREKVLRKDGFLYLEVPNLFGIPLCEPVHFFTYSEDSLRFLMARCGFEVLDVRVHGFPPVQDFLARNDMQNLACLARPAQVSQTGAVPPGIDVKAIRRDLRRHYVRHGSGAITRQFRTALRETAAFAYYLVFVGLLERISPALAMGLARRFGLRRRPPRKD
jgi:2-polyprenyl-3-methyl-5-hydroxy-6-metoxy-1,4-benzoquinol methylase